MKHERGDENSIIPLINTFLFMGKYLHPYQKYYMFKFDKHTTYTMAVVSLNLPAFPIFDLTEKGQVEYAMEQILETFSYFMQDCWCYR